MRPKRRFSAFWVLFIVLIGIAVFFLGWRRFGAASTDKGSISSNSVDADASPRAPRASADCIGSAVFSLRKAASSADRVAELRKLRGALMSLPSAERNGQIRSFWKSGQDVSLSMAFAIGPDHQITGWPSLRVFLADCAAGDPRSAAALSRELAETATNADELALLLRNVAVTDSSPEAKSWEVGEFRKMIGRPDWRSNPSAGFLESFDLPVHAAATSLLPDLAGLTASRESVAVQRAAFLALDRMAQRDPASVLDPLLKNDWLDARPETRANLFSRARVSDSTQRRLLEEYLLHPRISPAELEAFSGIFPNGNWMVSHNLLTAMTVPSESDIAANDRAALSAVNAWLADPRFASRRAHLEKIQNRLQQFVGSKGVSLK